MKKEWSDERQRLLTSSLSSVVCLHLAGRFLSEVTAMTSHSWKTGNASWSNLYFPKLPCALHFSIQALAMGRRQLWLLPQQPAGQNPDRRRNPNWTHICIFLPLDWKDRKRKQNLPVWHWILHFLLLMHIIFCLLLFSFHFISWKNSGLSERLRFWAPASSYISLAGGWGGWMLQFDGDELYRDGRFCLGFIWVWMNWWLVSRV